MSYPTDSRTLYFPLKNSDVKQFTKGEPALDFHLNEWFSKNLFAAQEPLLLDFVGGQEIYRFTYLRSFHDPIVIRVQQWSDSTILIAKRLTKNADSLGVQQKHTVTISTTQWQAFQASLKTAKFWHLYPLIHPAGWASDGAVWILEGVKDGNYKFVVRQVDIEREFFKSCQHLLVLSNLKIPLDEIY